MKITNFGEDKTAWMQSRIGKITGTRLRDVISLRGTTPKKAYWEIIAEGVALPPDGENPMDRGIRLEEEAMNLLEKKIGKKINKDLVLCESDENSRIAYSPDGLIGKTEGVEVKCLNSASHIEALITNKIPNEFYFQTLQPFIVNPSLKKLYFCFYDPRIPKHEFFYFEVNRKDIDEDAEKYKAEQIRLLKEIDEIVLKLTNF